MTGRNRSRTRVVFVLAVLLLVFISSAARAANEVVIKMATLVPQGSEWYQILQEMGAEWQKASNGRVVFRLYPGGVAGDEMDLIRKMRLGTIDSALMTVTGLSAIDRDVLALEVPLAYADNGELDCVLDQMRPQLERQIDSKGFVLLGLSDGGWLHFFTQSPVKTPEDMKRLKMFVWAGDDQYAELWKKAGFHPVPLPGTEISTALQTGLVNAVTVTPQGALLLQWYKQVHYMSEFKWAVLLGGMVISKSSWDKIPAEVRPAIKASALKACLRLRDFARQSESRDTEVLKQHGVEIVPVSDAVLGEWRQLIEGVLPHVRGSYVAAEPLDKAMKLRDQCRRSAGGAGK